MISVPAEVDPRIGTGNWEAFHGYPLQHVFDVTAGWRDRLRGHKHLWLCWNVSPRWSVVQQRLAKSVGWTPLVGFDPRVGPPPVEPGAILIDFNEHFHFPVMWPHFPLEFAFSFIEHKLAFWHADLLCRPPVLQNLDTLFRNLDAGELSAVFDVGGRRNYFNFRKHRYWELAGCTTRDASENQFYNGTGWWRNFNLHLKCVSAKEREERGRLDYDSGVGILYWRNKYNGRIHDVDIHLVKEGHCSEISRLKTYQQSPNHTTAMRDLNSELDRNFSLDEVAARLGIGHFVPPASRGVL
ncbi:MAG: hypothetical protein ABL995_15615 [Bryobacteraceae bacterium]